MGGGEVPLLPAREAVRPDNGSQTVSMVGREQEHSSEVVEMGDDIG